LHEIAERWGDNPALLMKPGLRTRVTTYAQLETQALRMGRYLQQHGVTKGDRVLLWAPNMPDWVAFYFACHLVGAVIVPLDVRSARDFVDTVIERTQPRLIVLSRLTARNAEDLAQRAVYLEQLEADLPDEPQLLSPVEVAPDDLALIMFTSGTTGDPKGVMLTQRNIMSNVRGTNEVFPCTPQFRLVSLLPLSHMLEQTVGMLAPLAGGARIVYPVSRQPSMLFRTIAENGITTIILVPQALDLFMNAIEREVRRQNRESLFEKMRAIAAHLPLSLRRRLFRSVHARFGGGLEFLIAGGAFLDPALANKWELMGVRVRQGFGTTEASPIITADTTEYRKVGAVGRPFPGVEVTIATDGEILVRGPNVFQGYWQNPDATAATLIDGWYHTGDLGMLDDEGYLVLKGRKKDLIVLANGQNVYPEDIENELKQHPAVIEGVVLGLDKPGGGVEVHAVLLMHDPQQAANAVAAANARLADHQRIQGYTTWPLEDFPRTHTLKVKKREVLDALNDVKSSDEEIPAPAATPTTDNALHRLIGEVGSVSVAQILPESTLGGDLNLDSLGRVELLSAIEGELGAYVDEAGVTPETTVAELEALVAAAQQRGEGTPFASWPLTPAAGIARELFLQGLLFPGYHLFWRVRVVGRKRLAGVPQPLMVAVNHHFGWRSYGYDPGATWMALPRGLRRRICSAGEEHAVFDNPVKGFLAHLVNAFPLSKEGNVRGSLEYIGRLLDLGWSVLIFPEGKLTLGGPTQPFMGGTGLLAVEANTPVVPVWIDVERKSLLQGSRWPWRGAYTVYIGSPLMFRPGTSYVEATQLIEDAVCALDPHRSRNGAAPNLADIVSGLPGRPNRTGVENTQPEPGRLPTGA